MYCLSGWKHSIFQIWNENVQWKCVTSIHCCCWFFTSLVHVSSWAVLCSLRRLSLVEILDDTKSEPVLINITLISKSTNSKWPWACFFYLFIYFKLSTSTGPQTFSRPTWVNNQTTFSWSVLSGSFSRPAEKRRQHKCSAVKNCERWLWEKV